MRTVRWIIAMRRVRSFGEWGLAGRASRWLTCLVGWDFAGLIQLDGRRSITIGGRQY